MGIETGLALLIGSGISAAAGIGGAKVASNAANKASQQQQDAAAKALDFEKQNLQTQEANFAPYKAVGQQSLGMLGAGQNWAPPSLNPYGPQPGIPTQSGQYSSVPIPKTAAAVPSQATLGQLGMSQNTQAPQTAQAAPQTANDPMVTVVAPDGKTTRQMPMSQAQKFVSMGAKIQQNPQGQQFGGVGSSMQRN